VYLSIAPEGTVRISAMAPIDRGVNWSKVEDLHYCQNKTNSSALSYKTLPCKYYDAPINVYPRGSDSSVSITTRITRFSQHVNNKDMDSPDTKWESEENSTFYLADVEDFTVCCIFHQSFLLFVIICWFLASN